MYISPSLSSSSSSSLVKFKGDEIGGLNCGCDAGIEFCLNADTSFDPLWWPGTGGGASPPPCLSRDECSSASGDEGRSGEIGRDVCSLSRSKLLPKLLSSSSSSSILVA